MTFIPRLRLALFAAVRDEFASRTSLQLLNLCTPFLAVITQAVRDRAVCYHVLVQGPFKCFHPGTVPMAAGAMEKERTGSVRRNNFIMHSHAGRYAVSASERLSAHALRGAHAQLSLTSYSTTTAMCPPPAS